MKKLKTLNFLPENAMCDTIPSPVGILSIITSSDKLHAVLWDVDNNNPTYGKVIRLLPSSNNGKIIIETKKQLLEYFQGKRKQFDLPLAINGTEFQMQTWNELLKIPYATTITYGEQAKRIGDKNKARAVGVANGSNPISIIIPCHRVIGSSGDLVGFGGGLDKKAFLLQLEQNFQ
jgi:methylated-DNA-[protein]-cysteine S-methyltransferase